MTHRTPRGATEPLEGVVAAEDLARRPGRPPDHAAENRALVALARAMVEAPDAVLQRLADAALELCRAESAGVSIDESGSGNDVFRWRATAGRLAPNLGGTMPRRHSPCGTVVDRNAALLMTRPERHFPDIAELGVPIAEVLLVPFGPEGAPVGTVWVVAHSGAGRFDAEDARVVASLSRFAAAAVQTLSRNREAVRAEHDLRESEARFRQMAETIPQLAWMARPDGHVFWYNRRWHEYTGTTPEETAGWGWRAVHDPDVLPEVLVRWERSLATGEPFRVECPLLAADGSFRPFLTLANPLRDAAGAIASWFGTCTDIGEQTRAKEVLARSLRRERLHAETLARVARASRAMNAVLSAESIARVVTEEARGIVGAHIGVTTLAPTADCAEPLRVATVSEKHGRLPADFRPSEAAHLTAGPPVAGRTVRRSGADRWGRLAVPLLGQGGKAIGLIELGDRHAGEFDDKDEAVLTQLAVVATAGIENARLYERVRDQDRRKDEFLATLAHELRNPLAPVRNGIQLLKLSGSEEVAARTHEMMERQIRQMVHLVDDLLDVSRVNRGLVELRKERITVRAVVTDAVETARPLVLAGGHELSVRLPDEDLVLHADTTRMAQVVGNLLTNAAKYTPDGGRIEVRAEQAGPAAVIRVTDTGVGIPKDMLHRVFDLFTQVGRSLDRAQGGLGIGLSLVRRLVELHGGTVTAESAGPGRGSTFTVTLPLAAGEPMAVGPPATSRPAGPSRVRSLRVLVVDDNVDGADSLATLLRLTGHQCRTAYSGPDALTAAREYRPGLVLLDIGLPGMNGYDVARELRTDPSFGQPVLVAVTGWGSEDDKRQAREAGFDDHLTKPAGPAELAALLARVPNGARAAEQ